MLLLLLACAGSKDPGSPGDDSAPVETDSAPPDSDAPPPDSDAPPADVRVFHVHPDGDDAASGAADAPWRTLAGAQANLRALRAAGSLDRPVEVELAAGTWTVGETWTFGPEDSGTEAAPVTWRGPDEGEAVLSGGLAVTGWTVDGADWVATLPEGTPAPYHLWVGGERRALAREPDEGFYLQAATPGSLYDQLVYGAGEVGAGWDLSRAAVHTFHDAWGAWETSRLWVAAHDPASRTLTFSAGSTWGQYAGNRWWIEGVPEALDTPGEWLYDPDTRVLRYRPHEGEDRAALDAVVPVVDQLLRVAGSTEALVEHLGFTDLRFAYTDWSPDADGYQGLQAAVGEGAAIEVSGAEGVRFEDCLVEHTGAHGIWFRERSQGGVLRRCELWDLGAGAVRFGTTVEADDSGGHTVDNSFLHTGGRTLPSGQGVWIGQSSHNTVSHNEIADFYYSGVQVGWYWGYSSTTAEDNLVTWNHIHHVGQDMLSDLGGVYTLGVSPGTEVSYNTIHDVQSYGYGGWGLYTDEGSSFVTMTHNLVWNVDSESFHQHYGEANVITNNILAYARESQVRRSREEDHTSFYFLNNVVYFDQGDALYSGGYSSWTPGQYEMDYNVWWAPGRCSSDWAGYSWADWQAMGNDISSQVADPLFVDAPNLDFRLDPASPALALGFETWDLDAAGLYGDADWVARPDAWGWTSETHAEPGAGSLTDDFESTPPGDPPAGAERWGESADAWVRVVDTEAHSGSQSLEFQDQAGLEASYAPHIWYVTDFCGTVTGRFAVKLEAGAEFYHEWRHWPDGTWPYSAGPSVYAGADGTLYAGWVAIGSVPVGQWVEMEVSTSVGEGTTGAWSLAVTQADGTTQRWEGLSGSPLSQLDWVGFVANADAPGRFWIDDLDFR